MPAPRTRGRYCGLGWLFDNYRAQLRRMVELRLDGGLAARLDPSDVLQEVYLDMAGQIDGYLREPKVNFYVWLRGLAWERLLKLQRRHLGAVCRSVVREEALPLDSSSALARQTAIQREKLVTDFPQVPKYRFALAASQYHLGNLLIEARRFQEAEATYRKTLECVQQLTARFPDIPDYQSLCGATLNNLANLLKGRGEWAEALVLTEEAVEHQQAALKSSPQNPRNRQYLCKDGEKPAARS